MLSHSMYPFSSETENAILQWAFKVSSVLAPWASLSYRAGHRWRVAKRPALVGSLRIRESLNKQPRTEATVLSGCGALGGGWPRHANATYSP